MTRLVADPDFELYVGDAVDVLDRMPEGIADCVVTSPPYLDARPEYPSPTFREFEQIFWLIGQKVVGPALVNVGRIWREGREQLWWVDLLRAAQYGGLELLDTLLWLKPNANPIQGRFLIDAHEYVFVLGRPDAVELNVDEVRTPYSPETLARYGRRYFANAGVKGHERPSNRRRQPGVEHELGARPRSYFEAVVGREKGNRHPAPMPLDLAEHLVKLASWPGQTILDPFGGSGTTARAARKLGRRSILIELSEEYADDCARNLSQQVLIQEESR